jgi:hypothetical protein
MLWWCLHAALAVDVVVVGAHDEEQTADEAEALWTSMRGAVELSGEHHALTEEELVRAMSGREELVVEATFLADGRRLLEDGRILYQQAQADQAVGVLEAAVEALAEGMSVASSTDDLWEAWMLLATARIAEGLEPTARDAAAAAAALQPERMPDPASYPPEVIDLYRDERRFAADEAGVLVLTVAPGVEEATVVLDGREVGVAPARVEGVLPGDHFVHVRTADGRIGARRVELASGAERPARIEVDEPMLGEARETDGGRTQQTAALYRALGRQTRADLLLLAGRVDDVFQLQLFDPVVDAFGEPVVLSSTASTQEIVGGIAIAMSALGRDGRISGDSVYVAMPLDVSVNPVLSRLLLTPTPLEDASLPMPVAPVPVEPGGRPKAKKTWPMWVGIGAGAAVLVGGVTALAVGLSRGSGANTEPGGTLVIGPPR